MFFEIPVYSASCSTDAEPVGVDQNHPHRDDARVGAHLVRHLRTLLLPTRPDALTIGRFRRRVTRVEKCGDNLSHTYRGARASQKIGL